MALCPKDWLRRLCLPFIIGLALFLRVWGIDFGMPLVSNFFIRADETFIIVPAVRFFETWGEPDFYCYPALMSSICAVIFQAWFWCVKLFSSEGGADLVTHFSNHPSEYFLLARMVSALAGTAAVWFVYATGRLLGSKRAGIIAALLFALAPLAVRDAHFGVTDSLLSMMSMAFVYFLARLMFAKGSLLSCAILLGGALAVKYSALVMLFAACLLILMEKSPLKRRWIRCATLGLVSLGIFLILNPYILFRFSTFLNDVGWEFQHQTAASASNTDLIKSGACLLFGPGEWVGLFLCVCWIVFFRSRDFVKKQVFILLIPLFYLFPMFLTASPFYRYATPALPMLAVCAGLTLNKIRSRPGAIPAVLFHILWISGASLGLYRSAAMDLLLNKEDTRTLTGRWIEENLSEHTPVVVLGRPEVAPQIKETRASMERGIKHLRKIYGERGVQMFGRILKLFLRTDVWEGEKKRYEIYRNFDLKTGPKGKVCVVIPSYPVKLTGGGHTRSDSDSPAIKFISLPNHTKGLIMDVNDSFYLPFTQLGRVNRPGPNLSVFLLDPPD